MFSFPPSFLSAPEPDEQPRGNWWWRLRRRLLPQSLAARTTLLLIGGLGVIQIIGLTIHAMDRFDFDQRMINAQARSRVFTYYRAIVETAPSDRRGNSRPFTCPKGQHNPDPRPGTGHGQRPGHAAPPPAPHAPAGRMDVVRWHGAAVRSPRPPSPPLRPRRPGWT
ncbi:hypothetical protein [Komagataeibacter kakiaceti]|uniref:hypothetical protein n=1 Tax=Komagataeibacter kakiaceti TaxID=943261 RepID=UPI0004703742|nr:hypothetical protein [Komagataeibacter kakiaceti]